MPPNNQSDLKYRTYNFSVSMVKFVSNLPGKKVFGVISDQLLRSATSIGANIIEAQAAASKKDFINFYQIALKSANETIYWLNLLKDSTSVDKIQINKFLEEADELAKMLGASLVTLKGKRR